MKRVNQNINYIIIDSERDTPTLSCNDMKNIKIVRFIIQNDAVKKYYFYFSEKFIVS